MNYEAIQAHIEQARIQRSVFLAELLAEAIFKSWTMLRRAGRALRSLIEGTTNYLPRSQA
jgi:hypothetical protein